MAMNSGSTTQAIFPHLTRAQIDATRLSSWYDSFRSITFASTVINLKDLGENQEFLDWLNADSIFIPLDSERLVPPAANGSTLLARNRSSSSASSSSSTSEDPPQFHLPRSTTAIRKTIAQYGGSVFPKLHWTSPRDAASILPQSNGPLRCYTSDDVFLLLKSSDLIQHDLDPTRAYASDERGLDSAIQVKLEDEGHSIELVLREYIEVEPSREFRCFVRDDQLIGISQRDTNYYEHLQGEPVHHRLHEAVSNFWRFKVKRHFMNGGPSYTFDVYLTASLSHVQLVDINPYRASTDPLLFDYEELHEIHSQADAASLDPPEMEHSDGSALPVIRVIDSRAHPASNRAAPTFGSSMMPLEMVELSQGRTIDDFQRVFNQAVAQGMQD